MIDLLKRDSWLPWYIRIKASSFTDENYKDEYVDNYDEE